MLTLDSAFLAEIQLEDYDTLFAAEIAGEAGLYYEAFEMYNFAVGHLEYAMRLYRKGGDLEKAREMLQQITRVHQVIIDKNAEVELTEFRDVSSTNVYFRIDTVLRQKNDSVWAILSAGSNDGVFEGSKGDVKGIYSQEYENRGDLSLEKQRCLKFFQIRPMY